MGKGIINTVFAGSIILAVISGVLYGVGVSSGSIHLQNISQEVLGASLAAVLTTTIIKVF